jgi:hypothetical protein
LDTAETAEEEPNLRLALGTKPLAVLATNAAETTVQHENFMIVFEYNSNTAKRLFVVD